MVVTDIRWRQRFDNFKRALELLREPIDRDVETLSALEQEGTIQRFEVTLELGWKTIKDYLQSEGVEIVPVTPRSAIKTAFESGIIPDAMIWLDMLNHRNLLAHTYDESTFKQVAQAIQYRYFHALNALAEWLVERATDVPVIQLRADEIRMLAPAFERCPGLTGVILFGSRAKGNASATSDVDLALEGVNDVLAAEALRDALDALHLPYGFDVQCLDLIKQQPLREHIERVGVTIWKRMNSLALQMSSGPGGDG